MQARENHLSTLVQKPVELDYLLYEPPTNALRADGAPLLLFLHGMGERGSDLALVKRNGPPREIEAGRELPFWVVAPQCPDQKYWEADSLLALLDRVCAEQAVDTSRVYLTGLSMGGFGTWALGGLAPQRFAAIAPVCAPFVWLNSTDFVDIPVWCFHGALDTVVPVGDSVEMVSRLRNAGATVRFTVYPDAEHDCWTETYRGTELYDWFLDHRREHPPADA